MSTDFQPRNDLERQELAAQEGRIPPEGFVQTLLGAEVFMPVYFAAVRFSARAQG